ncbi:MAG: undecaprenyl/decaprenyl-phosphate alpha-N-acetylglucosaminyl 1-phosphate transferase [Parcubacteria group bacterium]|nr:undecaprenyl/decaprenyl-phosphate alpha-N-acetylglucosaminyl 1-phosphate transferase [Parcubacteria group bacterium]
MGDFTLLAVLGFGLSLLATSLVRKFALSKGIVDTPGLNPRKIHRQPMPLLGGVGIYAAFLVTIVVAIALGVLPAGSILAKHLIGLLAGGLWLVIGGILDDRYNLPPKRQIIWPILAAITVIASGIGIESITSPGGGQWFLDQINIPIFWLGGVPYKITLLTDLFTLLWLLGVIYATKFFDGLDGLVSGITIIGSLVVFVTSLLPKIAQPETALLALIAAACFGGFLVFNFHPASIFLGESGSTLAGFLVGSLAIIAESKVITTLVVMSLPILDLIWVMVRRTVFERSPLAVGDKKHIHHRLLASGFSHRNAVLVLYAWAVVCGIFAFIYQGQSQWYVFSGAVVAIVLFGLYLVHQARRKTL